MCGWRLSLQCAGFWHNVKADDGNHRIFLDMDLMLEGACYRDGALCAVRGLMHCNHDMSIMGRPVRRRHHHDLLWRRHRPHDALAARADDLLRGASLCVPRAAWRRAHHAVAACSACPLPAMQIMFYSLNFYIGYRVLKVSDAGGSMVIHSAWAVRR
jgi:hypothetical protein